MTPHNGTTATPMQVDGFEALGTNFRAISEFLRRTAPTPPRDEAPERSWARAATAAIQKHPVAAAAIGFGLGYLVSRLARR